MVVQPTQDEMLDAILTVRPTWYEMLPVLQAQAIGRLLVSCIDPAPW